MKRILSLEYKMEELDIKIDKLNTEKNDVKNQINFPDFQGVMFVIYDNYNPIRIGVVDYRDRKIKCEKDGRFIEEPKFKHLFFIKNHQMIEKNDENLQGYPHSKELLESVQKWCKNSKKLEEIQK